MLETEQRILIRKAGREDLPAILTILTSLKLPIEGIAEHVHHYLIAEVNGRTVATMGLEVYGLTALLRSAGVAAGLQHQGIGGRLFDLMVGYARELGVRELIILTTTAERYFGRKGFVVIDRGEISSPVLSSAEFRFACPSSTVCMKMVL